MERLTVTPFGRRPVTAGLMQQAVRVTARPDTPSIAKWELFRSLCTARAGFGLSDRNLAVLNALLTFHPGDALEDGENMVVFPSNRALAERAHGMAESTLRRNLAALVNSGLIARHDSPNGKRYAARSRDGAVTRAFGFDLSPLLQHARQITAAAAEAHAAAERLKRLREDISLKKRDALKLAAYGRGEGLPGDWEMLESRLLQIHKLMRRKLDCETLENISASLRTLLQDIHRSLGETGSNTDEMSGSPAENERHHQNSEKEKYESEPAGDKPETAKEPPAPQTAGTGEPPSANTTNLPLHLVLKACPDILPYARHDIRHWHEFVALAGFVHAMLGISRDAWEDACKEMGPETAAITLAAILQRVDVIRSPGGYLRSLTRKAKSGAFSPGPMVMALLSPANTKAA